MIWVVSLPHTGTLFVLFEILKGLRDQVEKDQAHLDDIERKRPTPPFLIPLRHPRAVAETWKGRGKPIEQLPDLWRRLAELDGLHLAVDGPHREAQLAAINVRCGLDTVTDWPVVGSHGKRGVLTDAEHASCVVPFVDFYREHS